MLKHTKKREENQWK